MTLLNKHYHFGPFPFQGNIYQMSTTLPLLSITQGATTRSGYRRGILLLLLLHRFSRVQLCATPQTAANPASRSWDSPGKNTGVGCHFLLQCMKVKSESEVAQSCLTLSDPMDCSLPGSSIHGIFQAKVLEWGAIAFSVLIIRKVKLLAKSHTVTVVQFDSRIFALLLLPKININTTSY